MSRWLPPWIAQYRATWLTGDITAGFIVALMLIPQSLAYALLAGLPPQIGIYASILPLLAYACFGTSMTLAVGPVAVVSLMTATALGSLAAAGSPEYVALAIQLALLSGLMLFVFGLLRLGFLAQFLSHPVIHGFIAGSAIMIIVGQIKHVLGIALPDTLPIPMLVGLFAHLGETNLTATGIGLMAIAGLLFSRSLLPRLLVRIGLPENIANVIAKLAPMLMVVVGAGVVAQWNLHETAGVKVVGAIPVGLPNVSVPTASLASFSALWLPALLISLVGFVESVAVARSFALKRKQHISADRELLGLGAANVASAFSGGFPVTGGFARSTVNFAAGAHSPLASVVSAILMAAVLLGPTRWLATLPQAVLAATIIVAVIALVNFSSLHAAWRYDRTDALAFLGTFTGVIGGGVERGIVLGIALSLGILIWRSSRPHMAVVGRVPGTEHFRNINRHEVDTHPGLLMLRVDENLYFGNIQAVEDRIMEALSDAPGVRHLVLILSAVNRIDMTAIDVLSELNLALRDRGIALHLAEVKGPVMDRLQTTPLYGQLSGSVFLSAYQAYQQLRAADTQATTVAPTKAAEGRA